MTVKPRLQQMVEAAWPAISTAVAAGLKEPKGKELGGLVSVVPASSELAKHVTLSWERPETCRKLEVEELDASATDVRQLLAEHKVDTEILTDGGGPHLQDSLTEWAGKARISERTWVLRRIAGTTDETKDLDAGELSQLDERWRVVAGQGSPGLKERCEKRGIEFLGFPERPGTGIDALAYEVDRFSVGRLEDFALSYDYLSDGSGVALALTARVLLRGFDAPTGARKYRSVGPFSAT